jgi:hypothetical protein
MNRFTIALTTLALAVGAEAATAQEERWAIELRVNAAVPTQDVQDSELGGGLGAEATLGYRFMPHLAAYAGWDWIHFGPSASFAGPDMDFEETGYAFGLRFEHPLAQSGLAGWVRGGGIYDHIEIEDDNGDVVADSGHGLGWEAALGLAVPMGTAWSLTPGVRFRSLSRDIEMGNVTTPVDLRYLAVVIGFARRF